MCEKNEQKPQVKSTEPEFETSGPFSPLGPEATKYEPEGGSTPKYAPKTLDQKVDYLVNECGGVLEALYSSGPERTAGVTNEEWLLGKLSSLSTAIELVKNELS
jgi:hypothetical protein